MPVSASVFTSPNSGSIVSKVAQIKRVEIFITKCYGGNMGVPYTNLSQLLYTINFWQGKYEKYFDFDVSGIFLNNGVWGDFKFGREWCFSFSDT